MVEEQKANWDDGGPFPYQDGYFSFFYIEKLFPYACIRYLSKNCRITYYLVMIKYLGYDGYLFSVILSLSLDLWPALFWSGQWFVSSPFKHAYREQFQGTPQELSKPLIRSRFFS